MDDESFIARYRRTSQDFTRNRILTFRTLAVLLMAKGNKSLQLALNEYIPKLKRTEHTVSNAAYSKARSKLSHGAFIELNQAAVVRTMYEDGDYKTWQGFRMLAVDGSKLILPKSDDTRAEFGIIAYRREPNGITGEHCYARTSVLYDVLNRVVLDAVIAPVARSETTLARQHLPYVHATDLVICDRNYASYEFIARLQQTGGHFLIRCSRASFKAARQLFDSSETEPGDVIVTLKANHHVRANPEHKHLPKELTVRFVRVKLDSGEYEVLVTSLLDKQAYPAAVFKELYWLRWGIETFYGILKTRLGIENFSGYSPESIRQDFHAAVFLTGAETILTEEAQDQLARQTGGHPKKVNKAVSFNAIKYRAFELFYSKEPTDQVLEELSELFQSNPTLIRQDRKPPRLKPSSQRFLGFFKRKRKIVF